MISLMEGLVAYLCMLVRVSERERERVKRKITNALVRVTIVISK